MITVYNLVSQRAGCGKAARPVVLFRIRDKISVRGTPSNGCVYSTRKKMNKMIQKNLRRRMCPFIWDSLVDKVI